MKILDCTMIKSDGFKKEGKIPNGRKPRSSVAIVRCISLLTWPGERRTPSLGQGSSALCPKSMSHRMSHGCLSMGNLYLIDCHSYINNILTCAKFLWDSWEVASSPPN